MKKGIKEKLSSPPSAGYIRFFAGEKRANCLKGTFMASFTAELTHCCKRSGGVISITNVTANCFSPSGFSSLVVVTVDGEGAWGGWKHI